MDQLRTPTVGVTTNEEEEKILMCVRYRMETETSEKHALIIYDQPDPCRRTPSGFKVHH
jgi:hypothetical protein